MNLKIRKSIKRAVKCSVTNDCGCTCAVVRTRVSASYTCVKEERVYPRGLRWGWTHRPRGVSLLWLPVERTCTSYLSCARRGVRGFQLYCIFGYHLQVWLLMLSQRKVQCKLMYVYFITMGNLFSKLLSRLMEDC